MQKPEQLSMPLFREDSGKPENRTEQDLFNIFFFCDFFLSKISWYSCDICESPGNREDVSLCISIISSSPHFCFDWRFFYFNVNTLNHYSECWLHFSLKPWQSLKIDFHGFLTHLYCEITNICSMYNEINQRPNQSIILKLKNELPPNE